MRAQETDQSLQSLTDWEVMLQALESTTPVPAESLPRVGTFWSAQHAPGSRFAWPPLPGNFLGLEAWALGDGVFVLDDRQVDYLQLQALAEAEAALAAASSPMMSMMMSSLSSSYAYGNPVYLTNLVVSAAGYQPLAASFDIAGGTNFVPWDILTTSNLENRVANWNWLGIGYTANHYTFSNQPAGQAFYMLAKPQMTMVVAWGENYFNQCDVPSGVTNAVMVAGGGGYTMALLNNGTVVGWGGRTTEGSVPTNLTGIAMIASGLNHKVALLTNGTVLAWGDNFYGETSVPTDLTNATVISAQGLHTLALRSDGTVATWGDSAITNPPAGLSNVVAIAAGGDFNLAVKADGTVTAWGYNGSGQCDVPTGLSNVWDVAAGWDHSVALKRDGTVVAWGDGDYGEAIVPAGLSNVVAIAASGYPNYCGYTVALKKDGTVAIWGEYKANTTLLGLTNVIAIGAEYDSGLAIRSGPRTPVITLVPVDQYQVAGGMVTFNAKGAGLYGVTYQWQTNGVNLTGATNATLTLTNVQAAQAGVYHMVVTDNGGMGNIVSSNATLYLVTPPVITYQSEPTNVVCIYGNHVAFAATATAPGQLNGFPLSYQWKFNGTNIPSATTNSYAFYASDNSSGTYSMVVANAGGSTNVSWQVTVTNAINVTNDLLLIYNTNSADSTFVKDYYLMHRPMVGGANVLGIGCTNHEIIGSIDFTNQILAPYLNWLTNNPAKHPQYLILFLDIPSRVDDVDLGITYPSVQDQLSTSALGTQPFITSINMNGTNDCIGYINKLASFGTNLVISASAGGYGNTNYVLDGIRRAGPPTPPTNVYENYSGFGYVVSTATNGLLTAGVSPNAIFFYDGLVISNNAASAPPHATGLTNVAGYICWGIHGEMGSEYATNGLVQWSGNSGWWIIRTLESYNGQRVDPGQGTFMKWFAPNAFGGTNYSNTPIGASSNVEEPGLEGGSTVSTYFSLWASGKNFGICVWKAKNTGYFQAVGDPFVVR